MSEWKECIIGDLGKIITGKTPRTAISENYGGKIPFLSPSDNMELKYVDKTNKTLTEQGVDEVKKCLLPANAVCVSCIGSDLGKVLITTQPTVTNQQINSIIVNEDNDTDFIYYLMTIVGKHLNFISKTSTAVPIINKTTFSNYKISVPLHSEQKRIAAILSSLDEKIETNRKINTRLEELAQALFKSWFIDFEPFGGQMPEDWETVPINDMVETIIGGDWGKEEETGSFTKKVMCIRGADLNNIRIGEKGKAPIRYILDKNFKQKALSHHDIIVEISGGSPTQSTGRIAMISSVFSNNYENSLICTNFCKALKIKKTYSHYFYYLWNYLYDNKIMFIYENGSNGLKNLNLTNLLDRELCNIPTENVASDFYKVIESIFLKIQRTGAESTRLAALRDTLLPKLMSGELILE